jgi:hypothetical protein
MFYGCAFEERIETAIRGARSVVAVWTGLGPQRRTPPHQHQRNCAERSRRQLPARNSKNAQAQCGLGP